MSQHPLYVNILWHMHQPYYKDLKTNEYLMPWVRLHATKDYLDMPLIAAEYPNVHITFNMVPSLLEQIDDYANDIASDPYLRLAKKRAEDLSEEERLQLLTLFFSAQYDRMIKPFPRYHQLYERRGWTHDRCEMRRAALSFSVSELRDLQVWFFLVWIDPYLRERDPRLKALMAKERMYSEQEKLEVLEIGREITQSIMPAMKTLWSAGQIEISTTPYFHPILPLLVDTNIARRARPKIALPTNRFQYPEDAAKQIKLGLDLCEAKFGRRPAGMWPSEGSVSPELVPLFHKEKVTWIATDEEVLSCSLAGERFWRDKNGMVNNLDALYRPYRVTHEGGEVTIFFRDHFLSDLIGFKYAHWNPGDAAADLIRRLEEIQFMLREAPEANIVSIILDGENCWEHYDQDGLIFLRCLYQGLANHRDLKAVTPSEYLTLTQRHRSLPNLHSGSWINHDYSIWIGHVEDNTAWDLLYQARKDVSERIEKAKPGELSEEAVAMAWKSLYVAEGSDWNWWYGDDHSSGIDDQFDELYRRHLINAYLAVGLDPPAVLNIPITAGGNVGLHSQPCAFISPKLDGRVTSYYEWFSAGHYDPSRGGDSMHQAEHAFKGMYFGFDTQYFHLRIDLSDAFKSEQVTRGTDLIIYLLSDKNYKIICPLIWDGPQPVGLIMQEQPNSGWIELEGFNSIAIGSIIEISFSLAVFEVTPMKMLHFQAALECDGNEIERCPSRAPLSSTVPGENFEEEMWIV